MFFGKSSIGCVGQIQHKNMTTSNAINFLIGLTADTAYMVGAMVLSVLSLWVALLGLGWGIRKFKLYIYNGGLGEGMRRFGKPRWKGYKWWHSEKWNIEHS